MIVKLADREKFKAGDDTMLKEILHPLHHKLKLPYSLAYAFLEKGETSLLHSLSGSEVYFILNGKGKVTLGEKEFVIGKGDCIYVAPNMPQSVSNTGGSKLEFICIVSPPWTEEGEEIIE